MSAERAWAKWRRQIREAGQERAALERGANAVAREMRRYLRKTSNVAQEFGPLDVRVVEVELASSGGCVVDDGLMTVFVAKGESAIRQRFTVAHELAHLVLDDLPIGRGRDLDRSRLEELCDEFASELLIGRERLGNTLSEQGIPRDPEALLRLCGAYRVSLRAMMRALRPFLSQVPIVLLASRYRGHTARPDVVDFRIDAAIGHRQIFVPRDQRLRSLGLTRLADWAGDAEHGETDSGREGVVFLPRRVCEPVWPGFVNWKASVQGNDEPLVIAAVDVRELLREPQTTLERSRQRRSARETTRTGSDVAVRADFSQPRSRA